MLRKYPDLKKAQPYSSRHAMAVVRIQRRFKALLERIRREKVSRERYLDTEEENNVVPVITPVPEI